MEYLRGLRLLREDVDVKNKLIVGAVLVFAGAVIPILPALVLTGWTSLFVRRSLHRAEPPLPPLAFDMNYFGKLIDPGFKTFLVRLLWTLPFTLVVVVFSLCVYAGFIGVLVSTDDHREFMPLLLLVMMGVAMFVLMPVMLFANMLATVAGGRAEVANNMNAGLAVGEVFAGLKLVWKELLMGAIAVGFATLGLCFVGVLMCGIGLFPAAFAGQCMIAGLTAQIMELIAQRGGPVPPLAPAELA